MIRFKTTSSFLSLLAIAIFMMTSCESNLPPIDGELNDSTLIPLPVSVEKGEGYAFQISERTKIHYLEEEAKAQAEQLAAMILSQTGYDCPVSPGKEGKQTITLSTAAAGEMGEEAYKIQINEERIRLLAGGEAGLFYAGQTLSQLLPYGLSEEEKSTTDFAIGAGEINDYPRFGFRGSMLDVARHFFDVETVKKYIDYLAIYKMNILHLHLADDQGWRIEIKSWPKLTEIGGSTEVGGGEGGFYTQEEYNEIVQYAADRFIIIIPEIDMPGHTNAALASYAELNCDGKARELYTGTEVGFSTFCTDKEVVYQFVDDVIKELSMLTPGPYIHVGGDESHVTEKDDYIKFINRVQEIVTKYNKQLVGWDEVTLASLADNSIAQYWASAENAKNAVEKNLKVIMSPAKKAYLDMQYDSTTQLGLHWAGYIEVDDGYNWDPATMEDGLTVRNILGVEAPLWSETVTNLDEIEYMIFPRLPGYAEIGWTPSANRVWEMYKGRLANQQSRWDAMGINYYKSPKVDWK